MTPRMLIGFTLLLCGSPGLTAAEVMLRADRDCIPQGESLHVTITVRGSTVKPVIVPPSIPYCQIEPVENPHAGIRLPSGSAARPGAGPAGNLTRSITDLERQLQGIIGNLDKQGLGDSPLLREYDGMLRDIRRQALEALNTKPGPREYQAVYRVTPQRAGTLTLAPFNVRIGNQTLLTKPLAITIDPPNAVADKASPDAYLAAPPLADVDLPPRGHQLKLWHWGLAVVLAPILGALFFLVRGRRGSRPTSLPAPHLVVDWRSEASHLSTANTPDEVARSLTAYVRVRCALPAGEVTPVEAAQALRREGIDAALADQFANVLQTCYAARFAPAAVAVAEPELPHEARLLIHEIELRSAR